LFSDLQGTGWRRLIGSPKLQVVFRKRATNYRALLWKVTYEDKGSYESSLLCRVSRVFLSVYGPFVVYTVFLLVYRDGIGLKFSKIGYVFVFHGKVSSVLSLEDF